MSDGEGLEFHQRRSRLKPPLRPDAEIVSAYRAALGSHASHILLLGVTEELADIGHETTALDISRKMIAHAWPGDTATRKAIRGDWLDMPFGERRFSAAIGDGILAAIPPPQYTTLAAQFARALLPGARIVLRLYETPERGEAVEQVREAAMGGTIRGFHAFKWRLAMALATEANSAAVPVARIHQTFESTFPDRQALSAKTGWSMEDVSEIDAYRGGALIYQFPTRAQLVAHLPASFSNVRFLPSGSYELAERCPLLVADFVP